MGMNMTVHNFIQLASVPAHTHMVVDMIIKSKYIAPEDKLKLAELIFKTVAVENNGQFQVFQYFKDLMVNVLLLGEYTHLEFPKGEGNDWIMKLAGEVDLLKQHGLLDKIFAAVGSDYKETTQLVDDYIAIHTAGPGAKKKGSAFVPFRGTIRDFSFRQLHHQYILLLIHDAAPGAALTFSMMNPRENDNAILLYGYIDRSAGLSFQTLSTARVYDDGTVDLSQATPNCSMKIRYDSMAGTLLTVDPELPLEFYSDMVEIIHNGYAAPESVERIRTMTGFDKCRHPQYPDDMLVLLMKTGFENEGVWVRIEEVTPGTARGVLLNEPKANFGCKCGDTITAQVVPSGDERYLVCLM